MKHLPSWIALVPLAIGCTEDEPTNAVAVSASRTAPDLCTPFAVDDRVVTPRTDPRVSIEDHEVDPMHLRLTFLNLGEGNAGGKVAVVSVDPADGTLLQDTVQIIASGSTGACAGLPFGNGPEWAASASRGVEVYYHQTTDAGIPYIARATQRLGPDGDFDPVGEWDATAVLGSEYRSCVLPSFNTIEAFPLLLYMKSEPGELPMGLWRFDEPNFTEHEVPGLAVGNISGGSPARLIPETRRVVSAVVDDRGQAQMAVSDLESGVVEPITTYEPCPPGAANCIGKQINSVSAVRAPNVGPEAVIFYAIINNAYIDVYLSEVPGQLEHLGKIRPPVPITANNRWVLDEENIIDNQGNPFIVVNMASERSNPPKTSEIWIASPFATSSCHYRKVSSTSDRSLQDLDSLTISGNTTYVYYQENDPDTGRGVLHRAATGL